MGFFSKKPLFSRINFHCFVFVSCGRKLLKKKMLKKVIRTASKLRSSVTACGVYPIIKPPSMVCNNNNLLNVASRAFQTTSFFLNRDPLTVVGSAAESTLSLHNLNPTTETPSSKQTITLALKDYDRWSVEEVSAVLMLPKNEGGVGLSAEKIKPLNESVFDGQALFNIAKDIEGKRKEGESEFNCKASATKAMANNKDFASVSETTCRAIVEWVATILIPKPYNQWNTQETIENLRKPKAEGGAGLDVESIIYLSHAKINNMVLGKIVNAINESRMNSLTEEKCIEAGTKVMTSNLPVPEATCKAVAEWVAVKLNPKPYELWSTQEIIENLCKPQAEGGAGLTVEECREVNLTGALLHKIDNEVNIQLKESTALNYVDLTNRVRAFDSVPKATSGAIIRWISNKIPLLTAQKVTFFVPQFEGDIPYQNNKSIVKRIGEVLLDNCKIKHTRSTERSLKLLANFAYYGFGKTRLGVTFLDLWRRSVDSNLKYKQKLIVEYGEDLFNKVYNSELIYMDLSSKEYTENSLQRIRSIAPTAGQRSYFVVLDEVPVFCSHGPKNNLLDNLYLLWRTCILEIQKQSNVIGVYVCGKGAFIDVFGKGMLRKSSIRSPTSCERIDLHGLKLSDLQNIFTTMPQLASRLKEKDIFDTTLQTVLDESAGIPVLVNFIVKKLESEYRCINSLGDIERLIDIVLNEDFLQIMIRPWSEFCEDVQKDVFSLLVFVSLMVPIDSKMQLDVAQVGLDKISEFKPFKLVDIYTLASLLNCYVTPDEEDASRVNLLFPKRTKQLYVSQYAKLPLLSKYVKEIPQILSKKNTFECLISSFLIWKSIFAKNKQTMSQVYPFLKDTPLADLLCPELSSNMLPIKITKDNAATTWKDISTHIDGYLNKLNFFYSCSHGPEKFIIPSKKVWWLLQDKNVETFDFTVQLFKEINYLKDVIPDDMLFLLCSTDVKHV